MGTDTTTFAHRKLSLHTLFMLVGACLVVCNCKVVMKIYSDQASIQTMLMENESMAGQQPFNGALPEGSRALSVVGAQGGGGCPKAKNKDPQPLNYLRDKDDVIQVFKDCENDPKCYFTYHHVAKSGGTSVEENMFPKFGQDTELTCCHGRMLNKFRADPERYCAQKFTSWQVSKNKFTEIVETCQKLRPDSRTVVWTTFREPISTYVSLIHQMCNKNTDKREPHHAQACEVCDFTNETAAVWLEFAQSVELQIKGAYYTSHYFLNRTDVTTVTMEPNDLNDFWNTYTDSPMRLSNKEENSLCSFRPTSQLVKTLREAQDVYRRMVTGLPVPDEVVNRFHIFKVENFGRCRKKAKCLRKVIENLNYI